MTRDSSNDIAVIGISARFPGPRDLDEWWQALLEGKVLTTRYERQELLDAGVRESLVNDPEYIPIRGHLIDADRFDNKLFRMSPRDAEMLDPQHRLMLEVAWSALEDAGYEKSDNRLITGVFASGSGSGYMRTMMTQGPLDPDTLEQIIHGTDPDFIASLIAYKLNLIGPAIGIQTACSSSLVGLHLACQALRNGDCNQALVVAAGVAFPQAGHLHIPGGINSGSGVCRPFDKNADGVVEGSGVAAIVLRRLVDITEKDPELHGIILGTAINNDGSAKAGYFAPSISGQIAVIKAALRSSNVEATSIGYLETHGTGTHIGDPIEWTATSEAYKELGARPNQIAIGALKANIGHTDAASGLASLIRAMRVVKEGKIPPLANFTTLNPYIDGDVPPLYIPNQKDYYWPNQEMRRAAISAFGIGGTNAHVIIEQPPILRETVPSVDNTLHLIPLSAADEESLKRLGESLKSYLIKNKPSLADVSYTLTKARSSLSQRLVVCARNYREAVEKLNTGESICRGHAPSNGSKPVIFLFPGQGTQYPGMALPFASIIPDFSEILESCINFFKSNLQYTIHQALLNKNFSEEKLNQTEIAQPALFALEYALATSLIRLGITPSAILGHSLGEVTAACIAGAFGLEDAIDFVTERGRTMQSCPDGAMLAVNCNEFTLKDLLRQSGLNLWITALNTPEGCVVAGEPEEIKSFQNFLGNITRSRILSTNRAFHSPLIEPALPGMLSSLEKAQMRSTSLPLILNFTGEIFLKGGKLSPQNFLDQARNPVQFLKSLKTIEKHFQNAVCIEMGPGQILSSMAESVNLDSIALTPSKAPSPEGDILTGIGSLWTLGLPFALNTINARGRLIHLPTYPFYGPKWLAPEAAAGLKKKEGMSGNDTLSTKAVQEQPLSQLIDVTVILSKLWVEVLSYGEINKESDFFDLGGDSLLTTSLIRKVNQAFNLKVPPKEMLSARTLGKQVELLERLLAA